MLGSMDSSDEFMLEKVTEKSLGTSGLIEIFNSDSNQTEYLKVYLDGRVIKCKILEGVDSEVSYFAGKVEEITQYLNLGEDGASIPKPTVWLVQAIDLEGVYPIEVCATKALARLAIMRIRYWECLDIQNDRRLLGKKFVDSSSASYVSDYCYVELDFTGKD